MEQKPRKRNQQREERAPEIKPTKGEKRYFPDGDNQTRSYESGGYQEEVGNYGDQDEIQGPNGQGRDWQAEQTEDEADVGQKD